MSAEARLKELGIELPKALDVGSLPFQPYRIDGNRCLLSGHVPLNLDGSVAQPLGTVGGEVSPEQGQEAARLCGLALLATLREALGSLDRVDAWLRVFGMVNAADGFTAIPPIINGCSNLLLDVFGDEIGAHTRSAVGMAELPFGVPVEIEAEVKIRT